MHSVTGNEKNTEYQLDVMYIVSEEWEFLSRTRILEDTVEEIFE